MKKLERGLVRGAVRGIYRSTVLRSRSALVAFVFLIGSSIFVSPRLALAQGLSPEMILTMAVTGTKKLNEGTNYKSFRNWSKFDRVALCLLVGRVNQPVVNIVGAVHSGLNDSNSEALKYSLMPIQNAALSIVKEYVQLFLFCSIGQKEDLQNLLDFKIEQVLPPRRLDEAKMIFEGLYKNSGVLSAELEKFIQVLAKSQNQSQGNPQNSRKEKVTQI